MAGRMTRRPPPRAPLDPVCESSRRTPPCSDNHPHRARGCCCRSHTSLQGWWHSRPYRKSAPGRRPRSRRCSSSRSSGSPIGRMSGPATRHRRRWSRSGLSWDIWIRCRPWVRCSCRPLACSRLGRGACRICRSSRSGRHRIPRARSRRCLSLCRALTEATRR